MIDGKTGIRDLYIQTKHVTLHIESGEIKNMEIDGNGSMDMYDTLTDMWWNDNDSRTAEHDKLGYKALIEELKKRGVTVQEMEKDLLAKCNDDDWFYILTGGYSDWSSRYINMIDDYAGTYDEYADSFPNLSERVLEEIFDLKSTRDANLFWDFYTANRREIQRITREEIGRCRTLDDLDVMFRKLADSFDQMLKPSVRKQVIRAMKEALARELDRQRILPVREHAK